MRMLERYSEEKHFPVISPWFGEYGVVPHPTQLPPLGIVCEDDAGLLAAVFAYEPMGMGMAFVEWMICRPDATPRMKLNGALEATELLLLLLKARGVVMIRSTFMDERIARIACAHFGWRDFGAPCRHVAGLID